MTLEESIELERKKYELQLSLERHKAELAGRESLISGGVAYALSAMKGLLIVNGGGVLAILTFTGNLITRLSGPESPQFKSAQQIADSFHAPVECFLVGLATALIAVGLSYVSQVRFFECNDPSGLRGWASRIRYVACGAALVSLGAFCVGACLASAAMKLPG